MLHWTHPDKTEYVHGLVQDWMGPFLGKGVFSNTSALFSCKEHTIPTTQAPSNLVDSSKNMNCSHLEGFIAKRRGCSPHISYCYTCK